MVVARDGVTLASATNMTAIAALLSATLQTTGTLSTDEDF